MANINISSLTFISLGLLTIGLSMWSMNITRSKKLHNILFYFLGIGGFLLGLGLFLMFRVG